MSSVSEITCVNNSGNYLKDIMKKYLFLSFIVSLSSAVLAEASNKDHCRRAAERAAKQDSLRIESYWEAHSETYKASSVLDSKVFDMQNSENGNERFEVSVIMRNGVSYGYYVTTQRHVGGRSCKVLSITLDD